VHPEWLRPVTGCSNSPAPPGRWPLTAARSLMLCLHEFHKIHFGKEQESHTPSGKSDSRRRLTRGNRPFFQGEPHLLIEILHLVAEMIEATPSFEHSGHRRIGT